MDELTLGNFIKNRMAREGLKPRDLSTALDRSESYVSMLSNDKIATPPPDVVHALAQVLKVRERDILMRMGYLLDERYEQEDSIDQVVVTRGDPRWSLLDVLSGMTEDEVAAIARIVGTLVEQSGAIQQGGRSRGTRTGSGGESDRRTA